MGSFYDVQQFIETANRITELGELERLLEGAGNTFGFDYFALVHHVDLSKATPEVVRLYNYPETWTGTIIERGYFSDDPMHAACQKTGAGFLWSDVAKIIDLNERQKEILRAAGIAGMGEGFTVPAHLPGEYNGSCSFGTRFGRDVSMAVLPAAQYVGCFAFEAARRILALAEAKKNTGRDPPKSRYLTQRQYDCIVLAAQGKTDLDIATLLGISAPTVHQHIESAKRRYNVSTRMQLVVRALFDSHLAFADIVR